MANPAVQRLLDAFSQRLGIAPPRLDAQGWCSLALDELMIHLDAPEGAELLAFNTWLGEAPAARRAEVAIAIADANYLLAATQGATLGMNRMTGDVVLAAQVAIDGLTLVRFERLLANFAGVAEAFRARLLGPATVADPPAGRPLDFALRG